MTINFNILCGDLLNLKHADLQNKYLYPQFIEGNRILPEKAVKISDLISTFSKLGKLETFFTPAPESSASTGEFFYRVGDQFRIEYKSSGEKAISRDYSTIDKALFHWLNNRLNSIGLDAQDSVISLRREIEIRNQPNSSQVITNDSIYPDLLKLSREKLLNKYPSHTPDGKFSVRIVNISIRDIIERMMSEGVLSQLLTSNPNSTEGYFFYKSSYGYKIENYQNGVLVKDETFPSLIESATRHFDLLFAELNLPTSDGRETGTGPVTFRYCPNLPMVFDLKLLASDIRKMGLLNLGPKYLDPIQRPGGIFSRPTPPEVNFSLNDLVQELLSTGTLNFLLTKKPYSGDQDYFYFDGQQFIIESYERGGVFWSKKFARIEDASLEWISRNISREGLNFKNSPVTG